MTFEGQYGIRIDRRVVTDPSWRCVADMMRSAHGQGVARMPGEPVRFDGTRWVALDVPTRR